MLNWREYPFVRLVFPLFIGIVLSDNIYMPLGIAVGVGLVSIVLAIGLSFQSNFRFQPLFGIFASLSILAIGYVLAMRHVELNHEDHFKHHLSEKNKILGWVYDVPEVKNWVKIKLVVEEITDADTSMQPCSGNLLLYLEIDSLSSQLKYGDLLYLDASVLPVQKQMNPNAFNFAQYLHYKNIHYQSFVRTGEWIKVDAHRGNFITTRLYDLRDNLLRILEAHISDETGFAVASAILLGYRAELTEEVVTAYSDTGAIHILAVSGLHVGIVFWLIELLLSRLSSHSLPQRLLKLGLALTGIWLFALLTGASASVLRAATMFSFIMAGKHLNRNGNIYNNLAAAAFFSLLYNPFLLFEVGFQLSYLAVMGIAFVQKRLYNLWIPENFVLNYAWQLTTVSLAAQIPVAPITLYYFHQFPLYFWLSSLIVIPASSFLLSLGILLFFVAPLVPWLGNLVGKLLDLLIQFINGSIFGIQQLPGGLLKGVWINYHELILLDILVAMVMFATATQKVKHWLWCGALFTTFLVSQAVERTIHHFKHEMVVYQVNKTSVIDFFEGRTVNSIVAPNATLKQIKYSAEQHRWAKYINKLQTWQLHDTLSITEPHFWMQYPYFQFYEQRWVIVQDERWENHTNHLKVDGVLVLGNPYLDMATLAQTFQARIFVFDASNNFRATQNWMKACHELGLNCVDVRSTGAFVTQE